MTILTRLRVYSDLVVLPHSVFALPFALSALIFAAKGEPGAIPVVITLGTMVLVVLAVVAARTAAMAFNRLVDAVIDAKNPRTKERHLPSGQVASREVLILVLSASGLFLACAAALGWHCLVLAPFVLAILLAYSFAKRFTAYAHVILGLALALAPGGAWWVLRPQVQSTPLLLMAAVTVWVAGFDILYSCQDIEFDKQEGLHSIPARLGLKGALALSFILHVVAAALLFAVGISMGLGLVYFAGVSVINGILLFQHRGISETDLSRINRAFFGFNGVVSLAYLALALLSMALLSIV